MAGFDKYLQQHHLHLYQTIRKLMQVSARSFSETLAECRLPRECRNKLLEKDSSLVINSDLEKIVENVEGGEKTIQEIAALRCGDKEKAEILRGYLSDTYSRAYLESIWRAFQTSDIVPSINAGVVESEKPGSSMGYDNVITPELRDLARLLYDKKAKGNLANGRVERMYRDELRRCTIRAINSKNPKGALEVVNKIEESLKKWIRSL